MAGFDVEVAGVVVVVLLLFSAQRVDAHLGGGVHVVRVKGVE